MASAGKKYRPITCASPTIIASAPSKPTRVLSARSQSVSLVGTMSGFAADGLVGQANNLGRQFRILDQSRDIRLHDLAIGVEFFPRRIHEGDALLLQFLSRPCLRGRGIYAIARDVRGPQVQHDLLLFRRQFG